MNNLYNGAYRDTKVLITGITGFKGSWMAFWLSQMGARVSGYSLAPPTEPNHFDLLDLDIPITTGDIRDAGSLEKALGEYRPEIVFHMAAQALVRRSYRDPVETFSTNVMGTLNVFEACRKTDSVRVIVNITSDKCYENREWVWGYREIDPMGGYDPYSASKGCSELLTGSYRNSFLNVADYGTKHSILLASCRAGNVIGGGDWAEDRLIPDIVKAAATDAEVYIRSPRAIRPWQHVLEPLSGYLLLGQRLLEGKVEFAGAWNFGPGDEGNVEVRSVVETARKSWERIRYRLNADDGGLHEAGLLKLDCSRARTLLGWEPVWDTETAVAKTVVWYRDYYENAESGTTADISEYCRKANHANMIWSKQ